MAEILVIFTIAAIILFIGFFGEVIFKRTNIPDIIWLLIFGVILNILLAPEEKLLLASFAGPFGTLALIIILFTSGLTFDINKFIKALPRGMLLSILTFLFTALAVMGVSYAFGWPILYGLLLGIVIGGTSGGVIIPIVTKLKTNELVTPILTIESTATDVYVVVFGITIIQLIQSGNLNLVPAMQSITSAFAIGLSIGLVAGLIWFFALVKIEREMKSYIVTLAALLFLYIFVEFIGGSGILASLMFGLVLGNKKNLKKLINLPTEEVIDTGAKFFYSEIMFFFKTFFFVYLGLLVELSKPNLFLYGLLITIVFFIVRALAVWISSIKAAFERRDIYLMDALMGKGLAAAILAQLPVALLTAKTPSFEILKSFSTIVLSVIFLSILFTVIGVSYIEKKFPAEEEKKKTKPEKKPKEG